MHNTTEELVFYAWKHWGMQFSNHLEGAYTFLIGNKEQLLVVKDPLDFVLYITVKIMETGM